MAAVRIVLPKCTCTILWFLNPCLTKLFFVTRLTKGGCYNPLPRFSKPNPLWIWFWYQEVGMDLLYPYIPNWVPSVKALRSYDVITHAGPEKCDFLRKIGENSKKKKKKKKSKFRCKSSEYQKFTGFFCLYRRKMVIPTCFVSFSIIVCRYLSKWRINVFLKLKRLQQLPLTLWHWRLTLPPGKVVPPIFFHENERKGCKRD